MKKITTEVSAKKEEYGTIVATVHDKYGNLLQKVEQPVDSFNNQLWRSYFTWASGRGTALPSGLQLKDLANGNEAGFGFGWQHCDGQLNSYAGIVIGSGTTQTGYNTVLMGSIIDFSGTLVSGTVNALETTIEYDSTNDIATITRSFINLVEGSTVTVNEVGIANKDGFAVALKSEAVLTIRDVLVSALTLGSEETLTVQYKIRMATGTKNLKKLFLYGQYGRPRGDENISLINSTGSTINLRAFIFTPSVSFVTNEANIRQGLIFGTSNIAFNADQIDLDAPLSHGNSAGQIFYHPSNYTNIIENSTTNSMNFTLTRAVENRTGSNVTISEIGVFSSGGRSSVNERYMFYRAPIDPPVTVTNGNSVTFNYEICYTV
jgi:hypothetical protein